MSGPALTTCRVDPASGIMRDSPRPLHLRNQTYAERYDWDTLFHDVYRVGPHVVFQGPPFFNFLAHLKRSAPFAGAFGFPRFRARHIGQDKRGEIWLKSDADAFAIDCPLGHFEIAVQPNQSDLFAGRRVLLTITKDNRLEWIADWLRFYRAEHGADGAIIYDNGSTLYSSDDLRAAAARAVPGMTVVVVDWPFRFGPSGGRAGAVDGIETPWDSDFCQPAKSQHARFRFLQSARSVLNVDIDELVIANGSRSIFEATEQSASGLVKFAGWWIGTAADHVMDPGSCRHADFVYRDAGDNVSCPPKWCVVPSAFDRNASWSVHNVFGTPANRQVSEEFTYRHFRAISTSWKYDRWSAGKPALPTRLTRDDALAEAFARAGLTRSIAA